MVSTSWTAQPLLACEADDEPEPTGDPHAVTRCHTDRDDLAVDGADPVDAALAHADEHHHGHLCAVLGVRHDRHCGGRGAAR